MAEHSVLDEREWSRGSEEEEPWGRDWDGEVPGAGSA